MIKQELIENYTIKELAEELITAKKQNKHGADCIKSLKSIIDKKELEIKQIDDVLQKHLGIKHTDVDTPDEFERLLSDAIKSKDEPIFPIEPIDVASMLINAKRERKRTSLDYAFCGFAGLKKEDVPEVVICNKYSKRDLRKIAEHLLVYCDDDEVHEE